jgi:hypothetical protein
MAGTIVVDRIESDSSYTSTINVASKVNFAGGMQIGGQDTTFGGMRNRIINGDMRIDQRNAGASVTINSDQYTVDRWKAFQTATGKYSVQQNAGSVTPPAGFTNYLGATSLSSYSVTSGNYFLLNQPIEGYNVADLNFGTANAKAVTISFWVRSSLTGTFGAALLNSNFNRTYPFTYTISAANTWEQKSVTFAGDTTGTWETGNGNGMQLRFVLGCGSSRLSSSINQWVAGGFDGPTGATSVVGTNGATFYITGVQLEKGSSATAFENRMYGQELQLCQRYYQQIGKSNNTAYLPYAVGSGVSGTLCSIILNYPVMMRTNPSFTFTGATNTFLLSGIPVTAVSGDIMGVSNCMYTASVSSGMSSGAGARHYQNNQAASSLELSAEL